MAQRIQSLGHHAGLKKIAHISAPVYNAGRPNEHLASDYRPRTWPTADSAPRRCLTKLSLNALPIELKAARTIMSQTINQAGLQLIESFEGLRLTAYQDSVGVWTIGYGLTLGVHQGQTITQPQAQAFLQQDLGVAEAAVNRLGLPLTDNQFAALVSFTFNLGAGNLNNLMKNGLAAAADRILLFDHAGGRVLPGLTRRRQAERALFLTPDTPAQ